MLLGLRSVIYPVRDLTVAKTWYRAVLGQEPYFDQPTYVGFSVGGFELGLVPNAEARSGEGGPVAYWGVANIEEALQRLRDAGAAEQSPIHDVGDGIRMATVTDPSGNAVGIIENPHFSAADTR
jgi:predicted enzyme related to lactoylglutathione lyase